MDANSPGPSSLKPATYEQAVCYRSRCYSFHNVLTIYQLMGGVYFSIFLFSLQWNPPPLWGPFCFPTNTTNSIVVSQKTVLNTELNTLANIHQTSLFIIRQGIRKPFRKTVWRIRIGLMQIRIPLKSQRGSMDLVNYGGQNKKVFPKFILKLYWGPSWVPLAFGYFCSDWCMSCFQLKVQQSSG